MASLYFEERKRQGSHDEEEEEEDEVAPFDEKEQEQQRQNLQDLSELEDYTTEIAASPPPTPLRNNNNNNNDGDGSLVGIEPNLLERSFMKQNEQLMATTAPAPTPAQLPKSESSNMNTNNEQHQTPIVSPRRQIEFGQSARRQRLTPPSAPSIANEDDEESIMDADVHVIGPAPTGTTADSSPSTIASSNNGGTGGDDDVMGNPPNGNFASPPASGGQSAGHSDPPINRKADVVKGKDPEGKSGLSKKKPVPPPPDADSEGDKKRRCSKATICALCCCFLVLIAVAVAVVIVMGKKGKSSSQNNPANGSGGGDVSPSAPAPTFPLPTIEPTPMPLIPNDICKGAIMIPNKNHELTASTGNGATTRGEVDFESVETSCGGRVGDGPGLWYAMVGGGRDVAVSTCSEETQFDTKIAIYSGNCDGDDSGNDVSNSLTCVAEDDDSCGIASTVTWFAEQDTLYYILVRAQPFL